MGNSLVVVLVTAVDMRDVRLPLIVRVRTFVVTNVMVEVEISTKVSVTVITGVEMGGAENAVD